MVCTALVPYLCGAWRAVEGRADVLDGCAHQVDLMGADSVTLCGATGNVCTEETVHALALLGCDTGADPTRLPDAIRQLPALIGHDVPSPLLTAGRRLDLHRTPAYFEQIRARAEAR